MGIKRSCLRHAVRHGWNTANIQQKNLLHNCIARPQKQVMWNDLLVKCLLCTWWYDGINPYPYWGKITPNYLLVKLLLVLLTRRTKKVSWANFLLNQCIKFRLSSHLCHNKYVIFHFQLMCLLHRVKVCGILYSAGILLLIGRSYSWDLANPAVDTSDANFAFYSHVIATINPNCILISLTGISKCNSSEEAPCSSTSWTVCIIWRCTVLQSLIRSLLNFYLFGAFVLQHRRIYIYIYMDYFS